MANGGDSLSSKDHSAEGVNAQADRTALRPAQRRPADEASEDIHTRESEY